MANAVSLFSQLLLGVGLAAIAPGLIRARRRDQLSANLCRRQRFRRGRKCGESMAIPVASSSPHENPRTEPSGVQAASRWYR